jgi:hypothetical protein
MPTPCHRPRSGLRAVLLLSGLTLLANLAPAAPVLVSWTSPTTNADGPPLRDLGGYRLHYGTASRLYSTHVDTDLVPSAALSGLVAGQTYYFVATAYDTPGNESQYSKEVPYTVPASADTTLPTVAITAPLNGAVVARKSTVTIAVTAADSVGVTRVDVFVDGQLTCTDTTAVYSCAWAVPAAGGNRTYGLQAKAVDAGVPSVDGMKRAATTQQEIAAPSPPVRLECHVEQCKGDRARRHATGAPRAGLIDVRPRRRAYATEYAQDDSSVDGGNRYVLPHAQFGRC